MKNITEKLAILSLSPSQVDILISIPSFAIMIMILINTRLAKYLNERLMIIGGLLLLSLSGTAPLFIQNYTFVLISRILLGLGIGLINSRAVSMISERFSGNERTVLLGYRSSAETLGNAFLTFIAGRLLLIHWTRVFIIYALGFVILILYLAFVPKRPENGGSLSVYCPASRIYDSLLCVIRRIPNLHQFLHFPAYAPPSTGKGLCRRIPGQCNSRRLPDSWNYIRDPLWKTGIYLPRTSFFHQRTNLLLRTVNNSPGRKHYRSLYWCYNQRPGTYRRHHLCF